MDSQDEEPTTRELKVEQAERERIEEKMRDDAELPEAAKQHERRADKAAYLKRKLAERERAEREAEAED